MNKQLLRWAANLPRVPNWEGWHNGGIEILRANAMTRAIHNAENLQHLYALHIKRLLGLTATNALGIMTANDTSQNPFDMKRVSNKFQNFGKGDSSQVPVEASGQYHRRMLHC
eukprot:1438195-Pleurochrysis_carterae.AAC.2